MPDPRGPLRTVVAVQATPATYLTTMGPCGHVARLTRHFAAPRVGEQLRCFQCGPHGAPTTPTTTTTGAAGARKA